MISKKVLEAVFEKEWKHHQPNPDPAYSNVPFKIDTVEPYYNDNDRTSINHMVHIKGTARDNRDWSLDINIYELAHRCKIWAYEQGYPFTIIWANKIVHVRSYKNKEHRAYANTYDEVEGVFEHCEWIQKQND